MMNSFGKNGVTEPKKTGAQSPLKRCNNDETDSSIEDAVQFWKSKGFPLEKILLGLPAYAYTFPGVASLATTTDGSTLYQTYTGQHNTMQYSEMVSQGVRSHLGHAGSYE